MLGFCGPRLVSFPVLYSLILTRPVAIVRELKTLAKKKVGVTKIAKALKRTVAATTVKASMLGVSLDTRG